MTTIADVALGAGVSKATASRAFSRPDSVRASTRERVLQVARELGYTPSRVARSLSTGRSSSIGLVVPDISNPFFPPMIKAVQSEARRREHALFVADTDEHTEDEDALVRRTAAQVDGLVLASPRMSDAQLLEVQALVPVVLVNRVVPGLPAVLVSSEVGISQAVEHLRALGHRSVVYLSGPSDSASEAERRAALQRTALDRGLEVVRLGPFEPRFSAGVRAADLVLATGVQAVLAYNDLMAFGLVQQLTARGLTVGDDVSVIGFDDIWLAPVLTPPLTTIHAPGAQAGAAAVRLLVRLLAEGVADPAPVQRLQTELIVRATTGAARR